MYQIGSYLEAMSLEEAISALEKNENSMIIAGGTDVLIKAREFKKGYIGRDLVGVTRIKELNEIRVEANGDVFIGAANSFSTVEKNKEVLKNFPILAKAVGTVGGPQVRNTGTIGGNVCNGATSADSASSLFTLDAIMCIAGKNGRTEMKIADFYQGPGQVALKQGEVLVGIKIKKENYEGFKGDYIKFSQRKAMDIANLGCAALIKVENGKIVDLKISFGVAGPVPIRAIAAEAYAKGQEVTEEVLANIGEKCLVDAKARDSWRASKAFREQLIRELPQRAIITALGGK